MSYRLRKYFPEKFRHAYAEHNRKYNSALDLAYLRNRSTATLVIAPPSKKSVISNHETNQRKLIETARASMSRVAMLLNVKPSTLKLYMS